MKLTERELLENEQRFIKIATTYIIRPGINSLIGKLQNSDFFRAPASTKFHACEDGGLCWHSLNSFGSVIGFLRLKALQLGKPIEEYIPRLLAGDQLTDDELYYINGAIALFFGAKVTLESIVIVTLFHDLHKLNFYEKYEKSTFKGYDEHGRKVWVPEECYKVREDHFDFGDDGSNSNYIVQTYLKLSYEEAVAIQNHQGYINGQILPSASRVWAKVPLALYLHLADMESTYITERE